MLQSRFIDTDNGGLITVFVFCYNEMKIVYIFGNEFFNGTALSTFCWFCVGSLS